jgi:hypothetical protein
MMYRSSRPAILTLAFIFSLAVASFGQAGIRVNEAATRIQTHRNSDRVDLVVALLVENLSRQAVPAHVRIELVDPKGKVQTQAEQDVSLRPSTTTLRIPLPPLPSSPGGPISKEFVWSRLQYSIAPKLASGIPAKPTEGIVSAGAVTPRLFELHVAGPGEVRAGGHSTMRVRAVHPVTARPVAGVTVQASLDLEIEKPLLTKNAVTGRDGFATLQFTLPNDLDVSNDEIDVRVTGTLDGLSSEADGELRVGRLGSTTLSTDKPLYQPGQTLHMRLLAFGNDKKALADQPVTIEIADPEATVQYAAHVRTSRFGIASTDWQIPENLRLGTYGIGAKFESDEYQDIEALTAVQINRYELPTFTVAAKPDHPAYLPGQNAAVEIRGEYLFGEPVRHGHVRVVRETDRKWNYREQKWEIKEAETYEGDTDDQGRYVANVNLSDDHAELAKDDYEPFRDFHFAAYLTDASTRRTEQRRFDIRISKEPIQVYVIKEGGLEANGLPLEFFVSTDYADGSPAQCEVQFSWVAKAAKNAAGSSSISELPLGRVRTNRYGLAKVSGLKVPGAPASGNVFLSFVATDRKGAGGHHGEGLRYSTDPEIRVSTDKILYRPDDPIEVTLATNRPDLMVFVEAMHDDQVLASQAVRVRGGHADLVFPPNHEFQDEVTIWAYEFGTASVDYGTRNAISGSHAVLFPKIHGLQLNVRPEKSTYRPGDEATVDFRVAGPEGEPVESALGLVVVDKALEERQRTDVEFGSARDFYNFRDRRDSYVVEYRGFRRSDLDRLDPSRPLPQGMEPVAEILLQSRHVDPNSFESDSGGRGLHQTFAAEIDPQINPLITALNLRYEKTGEYPKTMAALRDFLAKAGIQFEKLRDPWGQPYQAEFTVEWESDVLTIISAGPDKKIGTGDDFDVARIARPYFKPHTEALQQAINRFHAHTGGYIRDVQTLKAELAREGSDLDSWKDPWGHEYRYTFGVVRTEYTVTVTSAGPDGRFSTHAEPSDDDFDLANIGIDYTAVMMYSLDTALTRYAEESHRFPQNEEELQKALQNVGIAWDSLKDPWGHRYYATFRQDAMYADELTVESYADYQQPHPQHTRAIPVTKQMNWLYIHSAGPDGIEGTKDDLVVATFSRAVVEQSSHEKAPMAARDQVILSGANGAISGTVTDASGAVVPGAKASAKNLATNELYNAIAGEDGKYILRNLPPGFYYVEVSMPGFMIHSSTDVPVRSSSITQLDVTLQVGALTQTVEVQAAPLVLNAHSSGMASAVSYGISAPTSLRQNLSTPRLREYFPETLLWQPELVTDGKGRAHLNFPLAGNITTWKLAAIASTVDGEIGTAEKEIRAFQPFFIEHDQPRFLTSGDQIDLPVVLRNYLDHPLQASVEMGAQSWFTLETPGVKLVDIAPNESASQVFRFTAITPVKQGKQRVTARSRDVADAIEKTVTVRPNGQEKVQTLGQVFREKAALDLQIPETMIPGSLQASLKIYPNLNAYVLESIEAIMARPYGCAEQTISSAYPSILYLRYAESGSETNPELSARARRYVQLGYDRLLSYQAPEGGFSYWGRGEADLALTAYALKFLADAGAYVAIDESVFTHTLSWLLNQAQPDGRWKVRYAWEEKEEARRSAQLTAYIARTLAESKVATDKDSNEVKALAAKASDAVNRALTYVEPHAASIDEPYLIAAYALAALDAGQESRAAASVERLRRLEHREGDASYWSLEMNTPFYGWGLTGRVETTALVLQALEKDAAAHGRGQKSDDMISRGLLFLLKNQDKYGVWYSTQATVDVLNALASFTAPQDIKEGQAAGAPAVSKAEILIDGRQVVSVDLPADHRICSPVLEDLSRYLTPGSHHVEVRRPEGASGASLQLVADYYLPWTHARVENDTHQEAGVSDALRLAVHFDKDSAKPGESITCNVVAERIGFRGYGMLLGEIGLPPGAEVDRASLEKAMTDSGWVINQYDILPDRVVVYLWPRAGGVKFSFTFKPRFGLKALTTPSELYDYYNPEARAVVEPTQFVVQ